jgi:hypothetical protein
MVVKIPSNKRGDSEGVGVCCRQLITINNNKYTINIQLSASEKRIYAARELNPEPTD